MTQREAHSTREEHHSVGTRVLLLGCTTAVILINTRVLGATGQGEIAWIQLGVLLVTGISGFLAGGAVVYLQKEIPLRAMLMPGHIWLVLAAILGTLIGAASGFLPTEHIAAIALLGWLQGMVIFHSQLLLAHHQIKRHNLLQSTQGGTLLLALALAFFAFNHPSVDSFLVSLGLSLGITAGLSVWWLRRLPFGRGEMRPKEVVQRLWRYGRSAQTGCSAADANQPRQLQHSGPVSGGTGRLWHLFHCLLWPGSHVVGSTSIGPPGLHQSCSR